MHREAEVPDRGGGRVRIGEDLDAHSPPGRPMRG